MNDINNILLDVGGESENDKVYLYDDNLKKDLIATVRTLKESIGVEKWIHVYEKNDDKFQVARTFGLVLRKINKYLEISA